MKRILKSIVCLMLIMAMGITSVPHTILFEKSMYAEASQDVLSEMDKNIEASREEKTYYLNKTIKHVNKKASFVLKVRGGAKKIKWVSSDKKIATVRKKTKTTAIVTAKRAGSCTIYAEVGGQVLSCLVQVANSTKKAGTFKKGAFYIGKKKVYTLNNALSFKGDISDFHGARYLYIGASRTKNTADAVNDPDVFFYSYTGCGIDCLFRKMYSEQEWKLPGLKVIDSFLKQKPDGTVLIDLGGNDLRNINAYISLYRTLICNYPSAQFWFIGVLPRQVGIAKKRIRFNRKLKAAFPSHVIDLYSFVESHRMFGTVDGVHYAEDLSRIIYEQIMRSIGRNISVNILSGEVLLPEMTFDSDDTDFDSSSGSKEETDNTSEFKESEILPDAGLRSEGGQQSKYKHR